MQHRQHSLHRLQWHAERELMMFAHFGPHSLNQTALLRYDSHTTQFSHLKCAIYCLLAYAELCNHRHSQFRYVLISRATGRHVNLPGTWGLEIPPRRKASTLVTAAGCSSQRPLGAEEPGTRHSGTHCEWRQPAVWKAAGSVAEWPQGLHCKLKLSRKSSLGAILESFLI